MSVKNEFCQIFESELKRKLSERAKSTIDEIRLLLNSFKFYDLDYIGIIDKIQWVRGILKTGLTGISESDLLSLFPFYDKNNSGLIDYKNFANYLYGKESLNPLPKNPNIDVFNSYNNINNIRTNNINITNNNSNISYNNINRNITPNNYKIHTFNNTINNNNLNNNMYESILKLDKYSNKKTNNYTKKEEMKKFFDLLLTKFKSRINTNNGITFFIFVQKLKTYEINNKINLNDLLQIFKEMRLDLTEIDIKNFFYMLDINEMNFININDIINKIKGEMNEQRKLHVLNRFDLIDKNHKGEININYLKIIYKNNAKYHPDVIQGIKSSDVIYNQFRQTLEMFIDINKILNDIITKEEFVDYYSAISASIPDDIYFQDILNGIYDLSKLYNVNNNDINNNNIYYTNNMNNNKINSYFDNNNYNQRNNYSNYNIGRNNKNISKSLSTPEIISEKYIKTPYNNYNNIRNNILQNNLNNYKDNIQTINNNIIKDNNRYNQNQNNNVYKEENKINNNTIMSSISDPYYRPRITPGEKGIKKFKKIIYNPITKELLYSNNFNEKYNNNNNNIQSQNQNVINEDKIKTPMKRYKNNIYLFDEDKFKQQKLIQLFNTFRNEILSKGEKTIFTIQKILSDFNTDYHPNLISFDNFCTLFQRLNIKNIKIEEIQKIFGIFDNKNIGYIEFDNFFKNLVGNMGREREALVRKIYDAVKKDQNGNIFVFDFKKIFNDGKYNEIFRGEKTKEYIYYEFLDNLEIFLNYRNKLYNRNLSNILNYDDFLRFFDQISMYIKSDDDFERYINTCWNLNFNNYNNNYKDSRIMYNNRRYNNSMVRTGSQIINW